MLRVVPAERRDAIGRADTEAAERARQPARANRELAVGGAVERFIGEPRDDFAARVQRLGATENRRQRQRIIHHQALRHVCDSVGQIAAVLIPRGIRCRYWFAASSLVTRMFAPSYSSFLPARSETTPSSITSVSFAAYSNGLDACVWPFAASTPFIS